MLCWYRVCITLLETESEIRGSGSIDWSHTWVHFRVFRKFKDLGNSYVVTYVTYSDMYRK